MNRFIRLGNIILNLDHVIEIRFHVDASVLRYDGTSERKSPALYIATTEMTPGDYGAQSRVLRFLDDDAVAAWESITARKVECFDFLTMMLSQRGSFCAAT